MPVTITTNCSAGYAVGSVQTITADSDCEGAITWTGTGVTFPNGNTGDSVQVSSNQAGTFQLTASCNPGAVFSHIALNRDAETTQSIPLSVWPQLQDEASGIQMNFTYQNATLEQDFGSAMNYARRYWQQFFSNANPAINISVETGVQAGALADAVTFTQDATTGTAIVSRIRWPDNIADYNALSGGFLSPSQVYRTAVHEIGHLLGQLNTLLPVDPTAGTDPADYFGAQAGAAWSAAGGVGRMEYDENDGRFSPSDGQCPCSRHFDDGLMHKNVLNGSSSASHSEITAINLAVARDEGYSTRNESSTQHFTVAAGAYTRGGTTPEYTTNHVYVEPGGVGINFLDARHFVQNDANLMVAGDTLANIWSVTGIERQSGGFSFNSGLIELTGLPPGRHYADINLEKTVNGVTTQHTCPFAVVVPDDANLENDPIYSWAAVTSAQGLPAGVQMSDAGVLTGTPTETGYFPVTANFADGKTASFTIAVNPIVAETSTCNLIFNDAIVTPPAANDESSIELFKAAASKPHTPVWHAEIHVQRCSQEFGVTCNGTGEPCHKTIKTCKDPCNFECIPETISHTSLPSDKFGLHIPDIESVKFSNSKIELFKGMPGAGSVSVTFTDTPGCDAIDDPHWSTRSEEFKDKGTRLEKFDQRHILDGRRFTIESGSADSNYPADYLSRNYFVDEFTPSGNKWTLKAKDALGFFDFEKSKLPFEADTKLFADLSPLHGKNHRILFDESFGLGIRAVFINGEALLIEWVATQQVGDRTFQRYKIVKRAVCGSTYNAEIVKAGTKVTRVSYYPAGTNITQVLLNYMFSGGNGLTFEDQECACGPMQGRTMDLVSLRRIEQGSGKVHTIGETLLPPLDTRTVVDQIAQVFNIWPYVNPFDGLVYFHEFCPPHADEEIPLISEGLMVDCKVTKKGRVSRRVTTTSVRGFVKDCTKGLSKENTELGSFGINSGALGSACDNPAWVPDSPKTITTYFISDYNSHMARKVEQRHNYIGRRIPREVQFTMHARDVPTDLNVYRRLDHSEIQNEFGNTSDVVWWVSSIEQTDDVYFKVTAEDSGFRTWQRWRTKRTCEGAGANIALGVRESCDNRECLLAW